MRRLPLLAVAVLLSACASTAPLPAAPAGAAEVTRTEANGDRVSEYRVGGQLRMVRVVPAHGIPYTLIDSNGDGRLDRVDANGPVSPVYFKLFSW
jgi:hypothetical protein